MNVSRAGSAVIIRVEPSKRMIAASSFPVVA
jgi:hypothetical protein